MYYPCCENKGADELRGYREADLRLCFRICKKPVFSQRGSYMIEPEILLYAYGNMNVAKANCIDVATKEEHDRIIPFCVNNDSF